MVTVTPLTWTFTMIDDVLCCSRGYKDLLRSTAVLVPLYLRSFHSF